jgi:glycosyltransferase involved in cell wall biosynthesis
MVRKYFKGEIITIGNEVPQIQAPAQKEESKSIIYLSRVDIWKGHEFLIKSFAKIAPKYPDWKLNIYGQFDPKRYKKTLEKYVKLLGYKMSQTSNSTYRGVLRHYGVLR